MCEVTLSIMGEVCGRWSITYPNLQHSEAVKLTKAHCQALHRLDETTLDEIPLRQETSSGTFTSLTITPKRIGVNIIKIRFGSTHSDGACTGQRISYHSILYNRERGTATLNVSTYGALISTSQDPLTQCDRYNHQCTFPGGIIY